MLEEAKERTKQWILDVEDIDILLLHCGVLNGLGEAEKAEEILINSKVFSTTSGPLWLYRERRAYENHRNMQRTINKDSELLAPREIMAYALIRLEKYEEAVNILEETQEQFPNRTDITISLAQLYYRFGKDVEATTILKKRLAKEPSIVVLKQYLEILQRKGRVKEGVEEVEKMERALGNEIDFIITKARVYRYCGRRAEALNMMRKSKEEMPNNLKIKEAYIKELVLNEDFSSARREVKGLVEVNGESPSMLQTICSGLYTLGFAEDAIRLAEKGANQYKGEGLEWTLVSLLAKVSRYEEAEKVITRELENRNDTTTLSNACEGFRLIHEYQKSVKCAEDWARKESNDIAPLFSIYETLCEQNKLKEALDILRKIRSRCPYEKSMDAREAVLMNKMSRYSEALASIERAIEKIPDNDELIDQKLLIQTTMGDFSEFDNMLSRLNRIRGSSKYASYSNYFFNINCHPGWSPERIYNFYREWYNGYMANSLDEIFDASNTNLEKERVLRIGYVSGDFRTHSVSFFSEPLLCEHEREGFELFAFATHNPIASSETTQRFKGYFDHWINCYGISDSELSIKIKSLEIDILIDLSGHTAGSRLVVFAKKCAPIQMTAAFGAGQTTGIEAIDYILCDELTTPQEHEEFLSEKRAVLDIKGCHLSQQMGIQNRPSYHLKKGDTLLMDVLQDR